MISEVTFWEDSIVNVYRMKPISQKTKTFVSASIKYRSDEYESDLLDVDTKVFDIWDDFVASIKRRKVTLHQLIHLICCLGKNIYICRLHERYRLFSRDLLDKGLR